jgi:Rrf2 family protein
MKITAKDEYGIRILLRIAQSGNQEGMSIPQLSQAEGISIPYMAKMTRLLRLKGLIQSTRGHKGGYVLSKPANQITVSEALKALDGALFEENKFCGNHRGLMNLCVNSVDCSVRSLWRIIQKNIDQFLDKITLQDLIHSEKNAEEILVEIEEQEKELYVLGVNHNT